MYNQFSMSVGKLKNKILVRTFFFFFFGLKNIKENSFIAGKTCQKSYIEKIKKNDILIFSINIILFSIIQALGRWVNFCMRDVIILFNVGLLFCYFLLSHFCSDVCRSKDFFGLSKKWWVKTNSDFRFEWLNHRFSIFTSIRKFSIIEYWPNQFKSHPCLNWLN